MGFNEDLKQLAERVISLNQNLSHEKNVITYAHELSHIVNNDFDSSCSAGLIEIFAHK